MKNINIIIAGCLVFGAGILASCGSDYLNTTPTKSIGTGTAIGTAKNAYKALNGIAKTMSTQQPRLCRREPRHLPLRELLFAKLYL